MTSWTKQPPDTPGYYWAKAPFLGTEPDSSEPVRVQLDPRFGIAWPDFVKEQAGRAAHDRVPAAWILQVHSFGSDIPYAVGDIDAWGPCDPA